MGDAADVVIDQFSSSGSSAAAGAAVGAGVAAADAKAKKKKQKIPSLPKAPKAPPKPTSPLVSAARKALRRKTKSFSGRGSTILTGAGGLEDDGLVRRKTLLGA